MINKNQIVECEDAFIIHCISKEIVKEKKGFIGSIISLYQRVLDWWYLNITNLHARKEYQFPLKKWNKFIYKEVITTIFIEIDVDSYHSIHEAITDWIFEAKIA